MISKDTIDKVFEFSRVEEVISDFIALKKSGAKKLLTIASQIASQATSQGNFLRQLPWCNPAQCPVAMLYRSTMATVEVSKCQWLEE